MDVSQYEIRIRLWVVSRDIHDASLNSIVSINLEQATTMWPR